MNNDDDAAMEIAVDMPTIWSISIKTFGTAKTT
jgi:hypothetical protein